MTKLHLGCWHRRLEGWTGVDSREDVGADVVADVRDLGLWASGEVDAIYACHVLEHIPRPDLLPALREWRRVLKPGGLLRISVPDFRAAVVLYNKGVSFWRLAGLLYGRQNYPENTHYIGFDYEYLAWLLSEAGFYNVRLWSPSTTLPAGYDDYSLAKIDGQFISLNLEATA
jgi:predicted SAM-dependent methyltransferase